MVSAKLKLTASSSDILELRFVHTGGGQRAVIQNVLASSTQIASASGRTDNRTKIRRGKGKHQATALQPINQVQVATERDRESCLFDCVSERWECVYCVWLCVCVAGLSSSQISTQRQHSRDDVAGWRMSTLRNMVTVWHSRYYGFGHLVASTTLAGVTMLHLNNTKFINLW